MCRNTPSPRRRRGLLPLLSTLRRWHWMRNVLLRGQALAHSFLSRGEVGGPRLAAHRSRDPGCHWLPSPRFPYPRPPPWREWRGDNRGSGLWPASSCLGSWFQRCFCGLRPLAGLHASRADDCWFRGALANWSWAQPRKLRPIRRRRRRRRPGEVPPHCPRAGSSRFRVEGSGFRV